MDSRTAFFHGLGYLKIPGLLEEDECRELREIADDIIESPEVNHVTNRTERVRIDQAVSASPAYLGVASCDRLLDAVKPIIGPDIELVENRHNHLGIYRLPAVDRIHRDVLQWSRSILTVLVYLSDCTDIAAATRVIPGSHLWPSTGRPNNGGTWLDDCIRMARQ
jgi:hypothetical protein